MGRVWPDMGMIHATGKPVGAGALLTATEQSLQKVKKHNLSVDKNTRPERREAARVWTLAASRGVSSKWLLQS